jgi:hypothetical protein
MAYTREHPSPRHREMMALYRRLHLEGEPSMGLPAERTYHGISVLPHLARIRDLVRDTGADTVLDYGCGKGQAYESAAIPLPGEAAPGRIIDYWDLDEIRCYDPCYPPHSTLPDGQFDGVICTDVLEHCVEDDLPWIVGELFGYARRFVFAGIASYAAKAHLPNGDNAHITIRPPEWWRDLFAAAGAARPQVMWKIVVDTLEESKVYRCRA